MNPRKKIYLSLITFGIIFILLIFFIIYPLFSKIKGLSGDFTKERGKLILFEKEIENLKEMESLYKKYQPNLEKIDKLFINPEFPIEFIAFLEKNAKESQLVIEISPASKKEIKTDPWPSLFFQISLFGSFPNFLRFFERLENSSYLVEISNLNLKKLTEEEIQSKTLARGDINASFLIKAYTK